MTKAKPSDHPAPREDDVLRRMLATPPEPRKPKAPAKPKKRSK